MAEVYAGIDYSKIAEKLREELQKLVMLGESKDVTVPAGGSVNLPADEGVDISGYKFKTSSIKGDYAMSVVIQVSDDRAVWDDYYSFTLTAGELSNHSWEEDHFYCRLRVSNPDTVDHKINYARIKGRRL